MPACPHCSAEIDKLTGFVPQATHEARLKAKSDEIALINTSLEAEREKAKSFEADAGQAAEYRQKYEGIIQRQARTEALATAGLKPELLEHVEILYKSAGADDFAAWLEEQGRAHPLLAPHFAAPGAPPVEGEAPPKPPNRVPPELGAPPAPPAPRPSADQIRQHLRSAEFTALPREKQREEMARLQAQVAAKP